MKATYGRLLGERGAEDPTEPWKVFTEVQIGKGLSNAGQWEENIFSRQGL